MKWLAITFLSVLLVACNNSGEQETSLENTPELSLQRIQEMDDSLNVLVQKSMNEPDFEIDRLAYHEAAMRSIDFYKNFPEHDFAPEALEKASAMYMAINLDQRAADWRDTLIENYPNFIRILDILELQKAVYDNFDTYNPEMIKKYSQMMLDLGDKLPAKKREEIEFRLEHIELDFLELAILQNPDLPL